MINVLRPQSVSQVRDLASAIHSSTNHKYDGKPYLTHLDMVYSSCVKYIDLLPDDKDFREDVMAACYCHDLIEDCRQTYGDVFRKFSPEIADLVFAVTNEKGKIRRQRESDKYFADMKLIPGAVFLKICDRLANVKYSVEENKPQAKMYVKEMDRFIEKVYTKEYQPMIDELLGYKNQFLFK